jgi:hypothetical protein
MPNNGFLGCRSGNISHINSVSGAFEMPAGRKSADNLFFSLELRQPTGILILKPASKEFILVGYPEEESDLVNLSQHRKLELNSLLSKTVTKPLTCSN